MELELVRPTTAHPRTQFYAVCTSCGWEVWTPLFASAHVLADQHACTCANAAVEVDLVTYIGNEKTAAELQLDDRHGNHLTAGAAADPTLRARQDGPVIRD